MKRINIPIFVAAGLMAAAAVHAAPFAMVTDLKGEASTMDAGKPRKLSLLGYIENPTEVKLDAAGKLALTYFASGVQYNFAGPARVAVDSSGAKVMEGAAAESTKVTPEKSLGGGLSSEQWRRLQQATVVMRSVKSTFAVVSPDNTVVLDREPQFEWTAAPGAKGYRLVIYGPDNDIVHESTTEQTAVRPGAAVPLEPGKRYRWKVDARGATKPVNAQGNFAFAEQETRERLLGIKPATDAPLGARAFYATLLEAQGHSYDARLEWKALARDYPSEPEIAQRAR
jgi:hypothetical protein